MSTTYPDYGEGIALAVTLRNAVTDAKCHADGPDNIAGTETLTILRRAHDDLRRASLPLHVVEQSPIFVPVDVHEIVPGVLEGIMDSSAHLQHSKRTELEWTQPGPEQAKHPGHEEAYLRCRP